MTILSLQDTLDIPFELTKKEESALNCLSMEDMYSIQRGVCVGSVLNKLYNVNSLKRDSFGAKVERCSIWGHESMLNKMVKDIEVELFGIMSSESSFVGAIGRVFKLFSQYKVWLFSIHEGFFGAKMKEINEKFLYLLNKAVCYLITIGKSIVSCINDAISYRESKVDAYSEFSAIGSTDKYVGFGTSRLNDIKRDADLNVVKGDKLSVGTLLIMRLSNSEYVIESLG